MSQAVDEQIQQLQARRDEVAADAEEHSQLSRAVDALAVLDEGPAAAFIAKRRKEPEQRRDKLATAREEHDGLQRAVAALTGLGDAPVRPRRAGGKASAGAAKRGRPKGSGKRSAQALELVNAERGLGASEIASRIGEHANYAYRILPSLQEQGKIEKRDRAWYPTGS